MLETTVRIKPVDRDGPSIVIFKEAISGKVAIGRGEFLRCADKKVSRVHAELELDVDGQLHLTPLHVNPCFYFCGGDEQNKEEVRKGDQRILNGGDHFSLLPAAYVYSVAIESVDTCKDKLGNGEFSLLDADTEPISSQLNGNEEKSNTFIDEKAVDGEQQAINNNADTDDEQIEAGNGTRKRTLPTWLVEAAAAAQSTEKAAVPSFQGKAKKKPGPSRDKIEAIDKPSTSKRRSFSDSSDNESADSVVIASTKASTNKNKEDSIKENDVTKLPKNSKKKKRLSCRFGDQCYRKNPAHLDEFSHPGDSDYSSEDSEEDQTKIESVAATVDPNDDRPECEFGINCYRKNTQHRADYKHTSRPRTQRKAAKEAKKKTAKKNGESDDSFEESFIDDDSDEYKPSKDDADYSDDEEDLKRLKKEADSFVKNKKFHKMH